jgi:predicted HicB family RNase H-like nuclease
MPKTDVDVPVDFTGAASNSREAQGVADIAAAIRASKPQRVPPPTYGRRARGYVQLNLAVSPGVKARLKAAADSNGVSMAELLEGLLDRTLPA